MKIATGLVVVALVAVSVGATIQSEKKVSFKSEVLPVLQRYCLPCHAEESDNPSDLSLDSYGAIMDGGKHGPAVIAGDPEKSLLIQKLSDSPPFGDRMPLMKKHGADQTPRKLTNDELATLKRWILEGAGPQ